MSPEDSSSQSRRAFLGQVGQLGLVAGLPLTLAPIRDDVRRLQAEAALGARSAWDLSWVSALRAGSDRAVVDAANINDGFVFQIATRYLDNCDAVYGAGKHQARVVLNLRTRAIPLGLRDEIWDRFELGTEYQVNEPDSKLPARRNVYLTLAPGANPGLGSVSALVGRGAALLVCDFAMGHLANRLAEKRGRSTDAVHAELRSGLVPGAYLVPSGMFGLARAQNAGCAYLTA